MSCVLNNTRIIKTGELKIDILFMINFIFRFNPISKSKTLKLLELKKINIHNPERKKYKFSYYSTQYILSDENLNIAFFALKGRAHFNYFEGTIFFLSY